MEMELAQGYSKGFWLGLMLSQITDWTSIPLGIALDSAAAPIEPINEDVAGQLFLI